jgi:iron complex transport system ATP-binding protein
MDITYSNISFRYNGKDVLKEISGTINPGEIHAIVGPNGSGKSTLLKCLDGILKPRKGTVYLNDLTMEEIQKEDIAKSLGYVQQTFEPVYAANVYNTVLLGRKPHINWRPGKTDKKIAEKVLYDFGLEDFALRNFNELSGGEKQRIHIARAMAQQPDVLLLDEPTSNLDMKFQIEIMQILKKVADKNISVVMAIHDLNLAIRFADKFTLIKNGQILNSGGMDIINEENLQILYEVPVKKVKHEKRMYFIPG